MLGSGGQRKDIKTLTDQGHSVIEDSAVWNLRASPDLDSRGLKMSVGQETRR